MANSTSKQTNIDRSHYDAIIVGAGVVGATLALALTMQKGWQVALVEKNTETPQPAKANIRATALGLPSQRLLVDLEIWQQLEQSQHCAYQKMFVWDENSDSQLSFDAVEYRESCLGWIVDHNALQHSLQATLKQSGVDCFFESQVDSIEQREFGAEVDILHQEAISSLSATWLFAADGVSSQTRAQASILASAHDYHQQGIVAKIRTEKSHQNTAWQRYLSTGSIALLPLTNGECSIVWSAENTEAETLLALSEQEFSQRLQSALQSKLGAVELRSNKFAFPLRSVRAEQYCKGSIVLLGDAAHGIHPMAGQGANLGFADISKLLAEIAEMRANDKKLFRAFRRYERQQKLHNYRMDTFLTGLDTVFRTNNPLLHSMRRLGLKFIDQQPQLKSLFAQQVLGK